jgi:sulfur carrier protein ThiS
LKVWVEIKGKEERELEIQESARVLELLEKLGINRETVVVFVDGRIAPEEGELRENSRVTILPIVTGG